MPPWMVILPSFTNINRGVNMEKFICENCHSEDLLFPIWKDQEGKPDSINEYDAGGDSFCKNCNTLVFCDFSTEGEHVQ